MIDPTAAKVASPRVYLGPSLPVPVLGNWITGVFVDDGACCVEDVSMTLVLVAVGVRLGLWDSEVLVAVGPGVFVDVATAVADFVGVAAFEHGLKLSDFSGLAVCSTLMLFAPSRI